MQLRLTRENHFCTDSVTESCRIFLTDQLKQACARLCLTLLSLHALFIVIHWFVTDSFSFPVAAIFYMAWFTMPLHVCLVVECLLGVIILAHIPLPRAQRSAPRGLTAFIQIIDWFVYPYGSGCNKKSLFAFYALSLCHSPPSLTHT